MISSIHDRLDKLEEISSDMKEIKEWIATVVKVTHMFEVAGCFMAKWSAIWLKIGGAIVVTYAAIKYGFVESFMWLRGFFGK